MNKDVSFEPTDDEIKAEEKMMIHQHRYALARSEEHRKGYLPTHMIHVFVCPCGEIKKVKEKL